MVARFATSVIIGALVLPGAAGAAEHRFAARVDLVARPTRAEADESGLLRIEGQAHGTVQVALAMAADHGPARELGLVLLGPDGSVEIPLGADRAVDPSAPAPEVGDAATFAISISCE